jgi:hypothetical protein
MLLVSRTPADDERGVAMVIVILLVTLSFTVAGFVAASVIFGVRQTSTEQARLQALAAAEGGRDYAVSQLVGGCSAGSFARTTPDFGATIWSSAAATPPKTTAEATPGCPAASSKWVLIDSVGRARDGSTTVSKEVQAVYPWAVSVQEPIVDGAIIEGGAAPDNISSAQVFHGDVILNTTGTVDCNGSSTFDGDLILPRGSMSLSNACQVNGDVIAYGDIKLYNMTTAVGGDVISTHGSVSIEGATVKGSVRAYGGVTLNNSVTVGGDVVAEGNAVSALTGSSGSMKTVGGAVSIGPAGLSQLDLAKVTGPISVSGTGVTKIGGVGTVTAAAIRLAGTCSPCTATPTPQQHVTGLSAPTFADPPEIGYPTWADYPVDASDWIGAGYQVLTADKVVSGDTGCNYQGDQKLINAVGALTTPTVIDARACVSTKGASTFNLYGVALALHTDVAFISPGFAAQNLTVTSADGRDHQFDLITPDVTADGAPTCTGSASTLAAAVLGAHVSGIAYTPCTLAWGSTGSGSTQWTGQLVAGFPDFSGTAGVIHFAKIPLPGDQNPGDPSGASTVKSALDPTLVSQREP